MDVLGAYLQGTHRAGQFRIEARVQNNSGTGGISRIGLDDVKTSTGGGPDTTPPETYITSGWGSRSSSEACYTDSTSNTFEFHSNEQSSTFECQLSKDYVVVQPWEDCTSPKSNSNLSRDELWAAVYEFDVRATDPAGNVEPTPAGRFWFIEKGTDPPPPPPTDTTAPRIMSTSPANGATQVASGVNITATFTEAMDARTTDGDPSTINGTTFKLVKLNADGTTTRVTAAVSYAPATNKAILNPASNLSLGRTYKATVTSGAQDLAGNPLDQDQSPSNGNQSKNWKFTVRR